MRIFGIFFILHHSFNQLSVGKINQKRWNAGNSNARTSSYWRRFCSALYTLRIKVYKPASLSVPVSWIYRHNNYSFHCSKTYRRTVEYKFIPQQNIKENMIFTSIYHYTLYIINHKMRMTNRRHVRQTLFDE